MHKETSTRGSVSGAIPTVLLITARALSARVLRAKLIASRHLRFTKPNPANSTVYTETLNGDVWPTQVQFYDSIPTLLSTTTMCYTFVTAANGLCTYTLTTATPATNVYLQWKTTAVPIPGASLNQTVQYVRDTYGNVTNLAQWNTYVGGLPAMADRNTGITSVSYTHLRAHETGRNLVCRLL